MSECTLSHLTNESRGSTPPIWTSALAKSIRSTISSSSMAASLHRSSSSLIARSLTSSLASPSLGRRALS